MVADPTREIEVSIVICTRNRASRLSGTLGALRALRTDHRYEVIWVDNASTDDTAEVLHREFADDAVSRYILGERIGLGAARNLGWQNARGAIVAFTDDDCYPAPDYVDAMVAAFADHPGAGAIGGRILLHNPKHARITIEESEAPRLYPKRTFVRAGTLQGANLAFRREALQAIGGIDPELGAGTRFPCEDIDAVTAVLWAGFDACFDPRPTVQHDHGRAEAEVPALLNSYDRGRGSFYAKYILRPDTRATFVLRWLSSTWRRRDWQGLRTLRTELRTAAQYAIAKRRFGALALAFPLGLVALAVQSAVSFGFSSRRRLRATKSR
ncbi:glycosyltransferase family 2 protein [Bradyrhizobium lablabi]|uniref:glycosyltransferase family 2 protein n=1 Tax=Bradyrhizobium lablabi TaxID=722472 RepID=UPI001BA819A0|nr:glycosyltransferase family A protein [Bradyrhizobium lablabi]MBR0697921.1 glycosyltransferase family 2 protein [Bradyrhizobium lablabi]